jgi:hypothetical protein
VHFSSGYIETLLEEGRMHISEFIKVLRAQQLVECAVCYGFGHVVGPGKSENLGCIGEGFKERAARSPNFFDGLNSP